MTDPTAGTWTAYIWSRDSADGGTTGPVVFGASVASYQPLRSAQHVQPDPRARARRGSFSLSVRTPTTPGDLAGSITVTPQGQAAETIPVTLQVAGSRPGRRASPASSPGVTAGRSYNGETEYYQLDLPAGGRP